MKYSQKRLKLFGRLAIVGGVFFGLFILGYYAGFLREQCHDNAFCFNERAHDCRPTDVQVLQENNLYEYSIRGGIYNCRILLTLVRTEPGAPAEFQRLQGEKMTCSIPKDQLNELTIDTFNNYLSYCHGPLKEGLYEIILARVYAHLVGDFGDIIHQALEK